MISTQFVKMKNAMIDEDIVTARIVNMQSMEFDEWCEHLADGSTVTAADVSAVMKQIEKRLPTILGFNTKVICSPEGLTFRPKVSGAITQSELKAKLVAKKAAETDPEKAALIDVDRALSTSDLTISDCTVSIVVDLPKSWSTAFMQKAKLKRVNKSTVDAVEPSDDGGDDSGSTSDSGDGGSGTGGSSNDGGSGSGGSDAGGSGGSDTGGNGSDTGGGGDDNGGGDGGDDLDQG